MSAVISAQKTMTENTSIAIRTAWFTWLPMTGIFLQTKSHHVIDPRNFGKNQQE